MRRSVSSMKRDQGFLKASRGVYRVREQTVRVNGMTIFYREAGAQLIESFYARRPWET